MGTPSFPVESTLSKTLEVYISSVCRISHCPYIGSGSSEGLAIRLLPAILKAVLLLSVGPVCTVSPLLRACSSTHPWLISHHTDGIRSMLYWAQFFQICWIWIKCDPNFECPCFAMWNQGLLLNNWAHSDPDWTLFKTGAWSHTVSTIMDMLIPVHSQTFSPCFHICIYLCIYLHTLLCYAFLYLHMFTMYSPHINNSWKTVEICCWVMYFWSLLACLFYLGLQWVVTMVLLLASMDI